MILARAFCFHRASAIVTATLALLAVTLVSAPVQAKATVGAAEKAVASLAAWSRVAAVLAHPRCLNCHQDNAPRMGNMSVAHQPDVMRGEDSGGVAPLRCDSCHGVSNTKRADTHVPGAKGWALAPIAVSWQGLDSGAICRTLTNPVASGGLAVVSAHLADGPLVRWAWQPGRSLAPVAGSHRRFMADLRRWIALGAACPDY